MPLRLRVASPFSPLAPAHSLEAGFADTLCFAEGKLADLVPTGGRLASSERRSAVAGHRKV
eukprot:6270000-Alexandrium_andersonii.AAC.1